MAVIALADVQQWLEPTKLTLTELDSKLEASARAIAFSIVGEKYSTITWVDVATAPASIRACISLLVAGWIYQRQYSQNNETTKYGLNLERKAMRWLEDLAAGTLSLTGIPDELTSAQQVAFYPNDSSSAGESYDASGNKVGLAGGEDIQFRMSTRW